MNKHKDCGSIRELQKRKKQKRYLLDAYHEEIRLIDERIAEIRAERGTKLMKYDSHTWYEEGRDRKRYPRGVRG